MNREGPGRIADPGRPSGNRERILATALRLFTLQGVDATPTAQISREAQVSTGTLFHYFPEKSSLVDQVYLSIKQELGQVIRSRDDPAESTKERIERCLRGYIAWGVANPEKVRFLDQFYNSPSLGDEVKDQVQEEFAWMFALSEAAVGEGLLEDLPLEFHAVMLCQIIGGILKLIESPSSGMSQAAIVEHGLAMLWGSGRRSS